MVGIDAEASAHYVAIVDSCHVRERAVEHNLEVVLEVFGHTATVACGESYDFVFSRNDCDGRATVESVDNHHRAVALGKCNSHGSGTFGRGDFGSYVVIGEIYLIVIWASGLGLVREPAGAFVLVEHRSSGGRHNGELAIVVNPRAWLVGLLDATYFIGIVGIGPSVAHLSGLRSPEVHTPRQGNSRVGVACRK